MRGGPSALRELTLARLRDVSRSPMGLLLTFGLPLLTALILGAAFRGPAGATLPVAVAPGPGAPELQALLARVDLAPASMSEAEGRARLRRGKVALVVLPGPPPRLLVDRTQADSRTAERAAREALAPAAPAAATPTLDVEAVRGLGRRYIDFLVPGLIGFGIWDFTLQQVVHHIVFWRTRKLLKRVATTPLSRATLLGSILLSQIVLALVYTAVLLLGPWLAFDISITGSLALVFGLALAGTLSFGGIALLVGARTEDLMTADPIMAVVTLLHLIFSGIFFDTARFPALVRPLLRMLPLTLLNDALRAVTLEGAGLVAVAPQMAALALWGGLSFLLAVRLFRWT